MWQTNDGMVHRHPRTAIERSMEMEPKNNFWTHNNTQHRHVGIHDKTWYWITKSQGRALRTWILGLLDRPGFAYHRFGWNLHKKQGCDHCGGHHNNSTLGSILFCPALREIQHSILKPWGPTAQTWWSSASLNDKYLLCRLTIPSSLFAFLSEQGWTQQQLKTAAKTMWKTVPPKLKEWCSDNTKNKEDKVRKKKETMAHGP
eukprot:TRINITY_DN50774_c0_g1_i1.p1 TRINITY_DN50774_c0_g1~~TRINITY_DN50774_c0_g1_i1.p1  ORF type:complete len:202 (+),score=17.86 TRINITY_DN50774_c0_g1_i1:183-788(+)